MDQVFCLYACEITKLLTFFVKRGTVPVCLAYTLRTSRVHLSYTAYTSRTPRVHRVHLAYTSRTPCVCRQTSIFNQRKRERERERERERKREREGGGIWARFNRRLFLITFSKTPTAMSDTPFLTFFPRDNCAGLNKTVSIYAYAYYK